MCVNPDHLELGTPADNVNDHYERRTLPEKPVTRDMAVAVIQARRDFGVPMDLIAQIAGVDPLAIYQVLKTVDPDKVARIKKPGLSAEEITEAHRLITVEGLTLGGAATRMKRSWGTVARGLRSIDFDYEEHRVAKQQRLAGQARQLMAEGVSQLEIARRLGVSTQFIQTHAKRAS